MSHSLFPSFFEGRSTAYTIEHAVICDDVGGADHATHLFAVDADRDGPTVVIQGGIHGDEPASADAAARFVNAKPACGKLVVIPRVNPEGLRRRSRTSPGHGDLNRQFLAHDDIEDEHAKALWNAIDAQRPDVFIDLHTSRWPRTMDKSASNGQAIYPDDDSRDTAARVAKRVSQERIQRSETWLNACSWIDANDRDDYRFTVGNTQGVRGDTLLIDRVIYQLGVTGFLVEAARNGVPYEFRVELLATVAKELAAECGQTIHGV